MLCGLKQRGAILIQLTPHNLAKGDYVYKDIHHTQTFHFNLKYIIVHYFTNILMRNHTQLAFSLSRPSHWMWIGLLTTIFFHLYCSSKQYPQCVFLWTLLRVDLIYRDLYMFLEATFLKHIQFSCHRNMTFFSAFIVHKYRLLLHCK